MFKLLAFILLIFFFFRLVGFALRLLLGGFSANKMNQSGNYHRTKNRPSDGNVNIDYVPEKESNKEKKNFKGGDYVDYQELD